MAHHNDSSFGHAAIPESLIRLRSKPTYADITMIIALSWNIFRFHQAGTPLAKGSALKCESTLFSFTTVNDKGLPLAKAGAGTHLPA